MNTCATRHFTHCLAICASLVFCQAAFAADVEWEGWTFDYSINDKDSGLVLTDVKFRDMKILYRASMPVMRVEYLNDACGPYADILKPTLLRPATQGAPESACNGQPQCTRTYTQNGEKMLEVGSNWQVGEYQIYQTYYFSENGYFDARVYSRGLQCLVDHSHHAHWLFDFDLDDAGNDIVIRADGSTPATEFNDLRSESDGWQILDQVSGNKVNLIPADDDGEPDDFSKVDVAVRVWRSNEVGRWQLGARGEIGDNFLNGESVDGKDIVLWYVSHLPHTASEGPSIWHASGPRIQVGDDTPPAATPEPPVDPPLPSADNLLANGNFEAGKAGWFDCGPTASTRLLSTGGSGGSQTLQISGGGCLYQVVPVTNGSDYTFACDARRLGNSWTQMQLTYLDENNQALQSQAEQIGTANSTNRYIVSGAAPTSTYRALVLLYSEDVTRFGNCTLSAGTSFSDLAAPDRDIDNANMLSNGGFEDALSNWSTCSAIDLAAATTDAASGNGALAVQDGGCVYQEFDTIPGLSYSIQCQAKQNSSGEDTSVTMTIMDDTYTALDRIELPVESTTFINRSATLTASSSSVIGAITLYSKSPGVFDDCVVLAQ